MEADKTPSPVCFEMLILHFAGDASSNYPIGSAVEFVHKVQRDLAAPTRRAQDMSHQGEGKAVLVISHFSHNLSVSL